MEQVAAQSRSRGATHVDRLPGGAQPWSPMLMAVAALLVMYIWRLHSVFPVTSSLRLLPLLSVLGVVLYFGDPKAQRLLRHRVRTTPLLCVGVILALCVLSIPGSIHTGVSFEHAQAFGRTLLLMVLVLAAVRDRHDLDRLLLVILLGGVVFAALSFLTPGAHREERLGGLVYHDPNDLGLHLVASLPIAVYFFAQDRVRWLRILSIPVIAFFLFIIIETGSRGAFVALVAVGAFLVLGFRAVPLRLRMGSLAAAFVVLSYGASDEYWDQMATILNPQEDYNWAGEASGGRIEVWKRGLGYMWDRPILGVGGGAFHVAEGHFAGGSYQRDLGLGWKWSSAHNAFVEIGAELGVFGLLAFLVMLWVTLRDAWVLSRAPPGTESAIGRGTDSMMGQTLIGAIVGFIVGGFFLSQAYAAMIYVLVALVATLVALRGPEAIGTAADSRPKPSRIRSATAVPHPMAPRSLP